MSMVLLQDGRSLDKERRLSTSRRTEPPLLVRTRTTPNRITRALSNPIEGSRAQKQAMTVAKGVAVAAAAAAVVTWAVSGISAFFSRRRPPSNAAQAGESRTSAATAQPVGPEPQAIDGEWVFMPNSMRLLLEHFDFELSNENESQIEAGSARRRLSSPVEAAPNIQNAVALLPYLKPDRVLKIDQQAWSELLIAHRLPLESNCLDSARHLPWGSIVVLVCHMPQEEGHARQSAQSAISAFKSTTDLVLLDSSSRIHVDPHV